MKIELTKEIIDVIDYVLADYCVEYDNPTSASKALSTLRNSVANAVAFEELKEKIKEEYPGLNTSIADFMDDRINEIVQKELK
jgi:hypothetical protein